MVRDPRHAVMIRAAAHILSGEQPCDDEEAHICTFNATCRLENRQLGEVVAISCHIK